MFRTVSKPLAKMWSATPQQVNLTAVSKTYPASDVATARAAGQLVFGENRVQEALEKWGELEPHPEGSELRLIGPLQTNKAGLAVRHFNAIESLDRSKLAVQIAKDVQKIGRQPNLYIQVNVGIEPQKAGVLPDQAESFCVSVRPLASTSLVSCAFHQMGRPKTIFSNPYKNGCGFKLARHQHGDER